MAAVLTCLCDGGVFGVFIDWRGYPTVDFAAVKTAHDHLADFEAGQFAGQ